MNVKALLVDDEEEFVEVLAQRLQSRGFHVDTALSGDDAIAFLEQNDADVVILDVLMPGRNGIDTLREIKRLRPITEVIMLTGHGTVDTAIQGMKLGAYDFLMKPTDTGELVEKMTKARQKKQEHEDRIRQAEVDRLVKTRGW
jgi:two-component system, OmpR family, response regulator CpxR